MAMSSQRITGRFPPAETSVVGDLIRQRRGARGLTPLDGALLHAPAIAEGWNSLLGAVRTHGNLPGDVRELMILRVAALNCAAFEWIQHEAVGRSNGLTTVRLMEIRNTAVSSSSSTLSPLQSAALHFADASTKEIRVSSSIFDTLKTRLGSLVDSKDYLDADTERTAQIEDLLVEATAVVATYNMVSRFLVALDVAGLSENTVPWPYDEAILQVALPNLANENLHVRTLTDTGDINSRPVLIMVNSLLTNTSLWDELLPYMLPKYNVILYDQRGHGLSSPPTSSPPTPNTLDELADDIALILEKLGVPQVHAVIGVSQGGATALNFSIRHSRLAKSIIACDTQAVGPQANIAAWDERIALANATPDGMATLAKATVARWFPPDSPWNSNNADGVEAGKMIRMVAGIDIRGFEAGARALQGYDLITAEGKKDRKGLLECVLPTLLVAGEKDAGGKITDGLKKLQAQWNAVSKDLQIQYYEVSGAGHLPMVDAPGEFWKGIENFLQSLP